MAHTRQIQRSHQQKLQHMNPAKGTIEQAPQHPQPIRQTTVKYDLKLILFLPAKINFAFANKLKARLGFMCHIKTSIYLLNSAGLSEENVSSEELDYFEPSKTGQKRPKKPSSTTPSTSDYETEPPPTAATTPPPTVVSKKSTKKSPPSINMTAHVFVWNKYFLLLFSAQTKKPDEKSSDPQTPKKYKSKPFFF